MIFDKNLCACVEKKQKSNSSTLADSKGKRVRENKMYMVLSTNLYIYTFSCIFPRPAAAFWVGRKSSSNRSSRKVLCLIVQKVVQKLAENYFLCRKNTRARCRGCGKIHYEKMHSGQNTIWKKRHLGKNTMEKGVEVSAKYVTKKCISGKIKWKKRHLGQNTMEKGVEVSAKDITQKCIVVKIQWKKNGFRAK